MLRTTWIELITCYKNKEITTRSLDMSLLATYDVNVSLKMTFKNMMNSDIPWQADQPHNSLPRLPPAHELESRVVLKACIEARAALAQLRQAA